MVGIKKWWIHLLYINAFKGRLDKLRETITKVGFLMDYSLSPRND